MNWNKNNNDNNPWGSGGNNNNPWGGGGSNNNMDFEESIKKARDRFGKFKIGGPRNITITGYGFKPNTRVYAFFDKKVLQPFVCNQHLLSNHFSTHQG